MKFYLAGRYDDLPLLRTIALGLTQHGHEVTSRWLLGLNSDPISREDRRAVAEEDFEDIRNADCFVLYSHTTEPLPTRQGHSVELGYAMGLNDAVEFGGLQREIVIIGELTDNVFHYCNGIVHFQTWKQFFECYNLSSGCIDASV